MADKKTKLAIEDARKTARNFYLLSIASLIIVGVGSVVMRHLEDLDWIDSIYFSIIALTTVGFGDITPETDAGKIFTIFYLIMGIAIIAALINTVIKYFIARKIIMEHEYEQESKQ